MKVNGIDIRKFNAVQLTAEVLPPSLKVNYEMITGAILPTEFDTDIQLGQIKICMYFRGKDRNEITRNMSKLLQEFTKSCELSIDGFKGTYKAFSASSDYEKMKVKTRYKLNIIADGYFYDDEIEKVFTGVDSVTLEREGTRKTPAIIEISSSAELKDFTIKGFEEDITVKTLTAGKTIVIDSKNGTVTIDGKTAFDTVDMFSFPKMSEKEMHLIFSSRTPTVHIKYNPMWI